MAKPLVNIFPKLRAKMAYAGTTTADLAGVLEISEDSVRRRLRGEVEFELPEIVKLMKFYKCTFEEIFGENAA
ncbi:helix-turn-helix domain-containing protein [[Clostridium] scindens]|uniref:helix-turn-helix domain-containing protein n=1 Tax=Clostridium scindens (strain JCM 10418 / VPI 12708) TaxID=29347 RepID=UPI00242CDA84|nr:helix-turn-helix transcriptional regulator [[Clostridium] scindens]